MTTILDIPKKAVLTGITSTIGGILKTIQKAEIRLCDGDKDEAIGEIGISNIVFEKYKLKYFDARVRLNIKHINVQKELKRVVLIADIQTLNQPNENIFTDDILMVDLTTLTENPDYFIERLTVDKTPVVDIRRYMPTMSDSKNMQNIKRYNQIIDIAD